MNNLRFNIMRLLMEGESFSIDTYAEILFRKREEISESYSWLEQSGYINGRVLTDKALSLIEEHRIRNAVILAAGMSTRFAPLSFERPKGLLEVRGETLIERQIRQLKEKGIHEVVIVTGHMKEKFSFLHDKWGVVLVEAKDYMTRNNHASVLAAEKYLGSTIISSSDLYFTENIFQSYAWDAYYCADYMKGYTPERGIITDDDDRILETMYGEKCRDIWVTLGYAYFNERFSRNFLAIVKEEFDRPETAGKFWADIQDEHYSKLYMYAKKCPKGVIHEFDSLEELREFDSKYISDSGSGIMRSLCAELGTEEANITSIKPLSKDSFEFCCRNQKYCCEVKEGITKILYQNGD